MLIAALVAGSHFPNAQSLFDKMSGYVKAHPSEQDARNMAWKQTNCKDSSGANSASDGDLDIALAYALAHAQWGSSGAVNYAAEFQRAVLGVSAADVNTAKTLVLLGDWVEQSDTKYAAATRSSDFMPGHYRVFAELTGNASWNTLIAHTLGLVTKVANPTTGLLPDFIVDAGNINTAKPSPANVLESGNDGAYYYNACRAPWRLGTDFVMTGNAELKSYLQRVTGFINGATSGDAAKIRAGYNLNGSPVSNSNYQTMAFVAPFGVAAMASPSHQAFLDSVWSTAVANTGEGYYADR